MDRARLRLAVDAVGGDAGAAPSIDAALELADRHDVLLVGPAEQLEKELAERGMLSAPASGRSSGRRGDVRIVPADEAVGMGEDPVSATSRKRGSSLHVTARAVAQGAADAMITAGNTGAAVLAAAVRLRRLPGVCNPALATLFPSPGASPTVLLDIGATIGCAPDWLAQFAVLGAAYARARLGVRVPRIGLLSNGSEPIKGGRERQDAHALLSGLPPWIGLYVGHVESYDVLGDRADVIVCDGFTGDVALKMYERTLDATAEVALDAADRMLGKPTGDRLRQAASQALRARLAAEPGGVLLGVGGVCVICHGAASAADLVRAGDIAAACVTADVPAILARAIQATGQGRVGRSNDARG